MENTIFINGFPRKFAYCVSVLKCQCQIAASCAHHPHRLPAAEQEPHKPSLSLNEKCSTVLCFTVYKTQRHENGLLGRNKTRRKEQEH